MRNRILISVRIMLCATALWIWGCGEEPPPQETKPKVAARGNLAKPLPKKQPAEEVKENEKTAAVDSKGVTEAQKTESEPVASSTQAPKKDASALKKGAPESSASPEATVQESVRKADAEEAGPVKETVKKKSAPETAEAGAETERKKTDAGETESAEDEAMEIISKSPSKPVFLAYDKRLKLDPFEPLFREEPEKKSAEKEQKPTEETEEPAVPARPLTPLEKLDLNQLKLVGIIRSEAGSKALVEEASGKGYIITTGTYIGIHSGRVVDIQSDRVIVEETAKDVFGKVSVRQRELKFQRPPEDEIL